MYNFVTTTLINSLTYGKKNEDLLTIWDKDKASSSTASDGLGTTTVGTSDNTKLSGFSIKRVRDFYANKPKEQVLSIYKAAGYNKKLSKATIDLSQIWTSAAANATASTEGTTGQYRLTIYVRLQGSENPYYANDLVFKGKPFYVEFMVKAGQEASTIAANIKTNADKYIAMVYEDKLLDLEVSGSTLTIEATDEYQRFTTVAIEKFVPGVFAMEGAFEPVAEVSTVNDVDPNDGTTTVARTITDATNPGVITVDQGIAGFGTYHHLMKDYRLPTAANTRWVAIQKDETPIPGAVYNQYTIEYCSDRGNMGTSVVGQPAKSVTTHVFWVKSDIAEKFEKGLEAIGWANGNSGDTNENGVIDTVPTSETKEA